MTHLVLTLRLSAELTSLYPNLVSPSQCTFRYPTFHGTKNDPVWPLLEPLMWREPGPYEHRTEFRSRMQDSETFCRRRLQTTKAPLWLCTSSSGSGSSRSRSNVVSNQANSAVARARP